MTPLNLYLAEAHPTPTSTTAMLEYGNAIKELAAANIFPATCCTRTLVSRA